jgi:cellulose synthase/poly-beta-1,6-N-acetylglucosamine synthase-like glycosyltransferase
MIVVTLLLGVAACYLAVYVAYQVLLFVANALVRDPAPFTPAKMNRIAVLAPAHNEELFLPRLVETLTRQDYPPDRYTVIVIADNCTDGTAAAARKFGVEVFERNVTEKRGKGYAIGWILERIDLDALDAVVIVDGDSLVGPSFLSALNLQLERGDQVIQCYNGVANPGQSWFTRLMDVSRTIANEILHPAKRKLGLSSHLMGNGMCFSTRVIRAFGWSAFSVGEDWEYYARLVLSGAHVGYSRDARVYHQESVNLKQASSQRLRWSGGRFQVLRQYGPSLFVEGIRKGNITCLDASLPLLFPNPSLGINLTILGLGLSTAAWYFGGSLALAVLFGILAVIQFALFMIGVLYTRDKLANALSLFLAPAFLIWKMGIDVLSLGGVGTKRWKPTERKAG